MTSSTERTVYDFGAGTQEPCWSPFTDITVGGASTARFVIADYGAAVFSGALSLAQGGGFSSVRSLPRFHLLEGCQGIVLRARGDGKRYRLGVHTREGFNVVMYVSSFQTKAAHWIAYRLAFDSFLPTLNGQLVPDAPPLDPARIRTFVLMITDRQAGPFSLEIAWIRSY